MLHKSMRGVPVRHRHNVQDNSHASPSDLTGTNREGRKMFNLRAIMSRAWTNYRKGGISFPEALHRAWLSAKAEPINAQRVADAKAAAGVSEETNTWAGWKALGYEVIHGMKALFGVTLIWGSRGDGATYEARFFGASQVQTIAE